MKSCGFYAGKGWKKLSIGLGKNKVWLATLNSSQYFLLEHFHNYMGGEVILPSSWFLRHSCIDHLSSDTIVINICIYDTKQIFIESTMCSQKIKQRPSESYCNTTIIIVIIIVTSWVYLLARQGKILMKKFTYMFSWRRQLKVFVLRMTKNRFHGDYAN